MVISQGSTRKPVIVEPIDEKRKFELEPNNPHLKPYLRNNKIEFIVRSKRKKHI